MKTINMEKKTVKKGMLIILSGPSGVGKGTIRRKIMEDKSLNLFYSISLTTRKPRKRERDGVDYYFVSEEEFDRDIRNDNLLEWAEFVGHRYGTPRDRVEEARALGKNVILEIEVEGTKQVLSKCRGNDVFSIFLIPPTIEVLEERIRRRKSESDEVIKARVDKARSEMGLKYNYHYIVLNDDVDRAASEIKNIIRNKMNAKIRK